MVQTDRGSFITCAMMEAPRYSIGKVRISAVTMDKTLRMLDQKVQAHQSAYICVANVQTTIFAQKNVDFCSIQNNSFLTLPDGQPLVWFAKLAGVKDIERITGPDLLLKLLEASAEKRYSHFFYGDTKETLTKMRYAISERFPSIEVKAMEAPPFRPLTNCEIDETVNEINCLRPTFVWVGLGNPKQERWISEMADRIDSSILIGVGAAFRFLINEYSHPHPIFQKLGLEGFIWRFPKNPIAIILWFCRRIPALALLFLQLIINRLTGRKQKSY